MIPRQLLNIRRPTGGSRVAGRWIPSGTETTLEFYASIQPLKAKEMETLPEGRRTAGESYRLYGDTQPVLQTVKSDENPDLVDIYGDEFEIFSGKHWKNGLRSHSKYIVTRNTAK